MEYCSLLKQHKLTEGICNKQVSDGHLEEISRYHCKDWKSLPSHLGLNTIVAEDIDRSKVAEKEKRHTFLLGWKKIEGSRATYKRLITALLKIDCREDAEGVCTLLQKHPQLPMTQSQLPVAPSGPVAITGTGIQFCLFYSLLFTLSLPLFLICS